MDRGARASVELSGDHSLGQGAVTEACAAVDKILSGSAMTYGIYLGTDSQFFKRREGPGLIAVDVNTSRYLVLWESPTFRVQDSLLEAVMGRMRATGKASVRAAATVDRVPITLPTIGNASLAQTFSAIMFGLSPPADAPGPDYENVSFSGVASPRDKDTAQVTLYGECSSEPASAIGAAQYLLGALSSRCEVYGK